MPSNTFKKSEHLYLEKDFEVLLAKGKAVNRTPFRLIYQIEKLTETKNIPVKVGVSVPKKRVRLAVNRNRIKRLVRECYRLNKHALIEYAQKNSITEIVELGSQICSGCCAVRRFAMFFVCHAHPPEPVCHHGSYDLHSQMCCLAINQIK